MIAPVFTNTNTATVPGRMTSRRHCDGRLYAGVRGRRASRASAPSLISMGLHPLLLRFSISVSHSSGALLAFIGDPQIHLLSRQCLGDIDFLPNHI